jgi:hypothetical protein
MLRLPVDDLDIKSGCNFAIAAVLGNVVSGASVTLHEPEGDRERGRNLRGYVFNLSTTGLASGTWTLSLHVGTDSAFMHLVRFEV